MPKHATVTPSSRRPFSCLTSKRACAKRLGIHHKKKRVAPAFAVPNLVIAHPPNAFRAILFPQEERRRCNDTRSNAIQTFSPFKAFGEPFCAFRFATFRPLSRAQAQTGWHILSSRWFFHCRYHLTCHSHVTFKGLYGLVAPFPWRCKQQLNLMSWNVG